MSVIQSLLGDQFGNLTSMLTDKLNFSQPQAESFIPEAAKEFLGAYQEKSADLDLSNVSGSASTLLEMININELASKVGISEEQVNSGIGMIMPTLLGLAEEHKDKLEGLGSLLSNLEGSPLGGMLSGIGGKLFGR